MFGNLEQDITIPYNVTIPEDHSNENYKDNMKIIERLETKLTDLVEQKLSRINSKWLNDRIPNLKMIEKWEEIRGKSTRSEKLFKGGQSESLIHYSELGDLYQIIKWSKNWKECFESVFKDLKLFESDMEQLVMIRNDIAHSRPLNEIQEGKLRINAEHFIRLIDQS